MMENPLLVPYNTLFDTYPFDRIRHEHYEPAIEAGILALESDVASITSNPAPATFSNTIESLERSGSLLDRVCGAFYAVLGAETDDELMEISRRISPRLTESRNNLYLNELLFARVKSVYDDRANLNLNAEESTLLRDTFNSFSDNGANLDAAGKVRFRSLTSELSRIRLEFDQNVLKDQNRFELHLTDESDLAGLPASICESARTEAESRGKAGWVFTLSEPSYVPFMRYASSRALRERLYRSRARIGNAGDEYDNSANVCSIVNLRQEKAQLLGYTHHASYMLKDKMARSAEGVYELLGRLLESYKPVAINEYLTLQGFVAGLEGEYRLLMPWDWSYYSEKLKSIKFAIDNEMLRPYFELRRVTAGIFGLATDLYGLKFIKNTAIPVYHAEVETYEVYDESDNFLAILYTDFFPRAGKRSGAWMNCIRSQYRDNEGIDHRPHIVIVMNFSRPTTDKPSLLTCDEVNTFLHEFGHALHGMLSTVKYSSHSGTSVAHDFVELPSQLMENWLREEEFLDRIALHYESGVRVPSDLIQKFINSSNFNVGYQCCRQVSFGLLDMSWHTLTVPFTGSVSSFERESWSRARILPEDTEGVFSCAFSHIFSGGYSAGYYGYKWSEVLDADAFSVFRASGIFNREVARSFRENILSKGGTEAPDVLYRRFRGQDPTIDALLRRDGILE